jgi:hypothetical protein
MKRLVFAATALIGLAASPSLACDRSSSFAAVAVPLLIEDHYAAQVLVAPVIEPLVVVRRPLFVPRARVQVFSPRRGVRVFVR